MNFKNGGISVDNFLEVITSQNQNIYRQEMIEWVQNYNITSKNFSKTDKQKALDEYYKDLISLIFIFYYPNSLI